MRKVLTFVLALGVAIAIGSAAGATGAGGGSDSDSGVNFQKWSEGAGLLSIAGAPGTSYGVYDDDGAAIAGGTLAPEPVHMPVAGAKFHIFVGSDYHEVANDPFWEWD